MRKSCELYYDIDKRGTNAIALAIQLANSELIKLVISSPQANPQLVQLLLDKAAEKFISREISRKGVGKKGIGYMQWDRTRRTHMLAIVRSIAATIDAVTGLPQFQLPYGLANTLLGLAVTKNNIERAEKL